MPPKGRYRYTREQLAEAVATSSTIAEVLRKIGLVPCGGNYEVIRDRCRVWEIDNSHLESNVRGRWAGYDHVPDTEIVAAVRGARSISDALRALGAPRTNSARRWLRKAIERLGIDTSHMRGQGWSRGTTRPGRKRPLEELLVRGRLVTSNDLRRRLIEEGLKEHRCEACARTEWEGEPIPLELDHINGDRRDNRLENLRLLCPNCHALTPTYRGRNIGNGGTVNRAWSS